MSLQHAQTCDAEFCTDLGCFGPDDQDCSIKEKLLWLECECSHKEAMQFLLTHADRLVVRAESAQPQSRERLSPLRVLQAACCHLRPYQLMNSLQGDFADVRIVSKLRNLSKRFIFLLSTCATVNAVHCVTVILAILSSCVQHHPLLSACEDCAHNVPTSAQFEDYCCTGCNVVISCSRLLISPHRMLMQAAQSLIRAAAHGVAQATAMLHLARRMLQHSLLLWPQNPACKRKHAAGSSPQLQGMTLFFLRFVEAMMSADSGPAAALQTGASETALLLAGQLRSTQYGRNQQKRSIVWQASGSLESAQTTNDDICCSEHQPVVLHIGVPEHASQAMITAASNTIIAAAACVDLWHSRAPPTCHEQLKRNHAASQIVSGESPLEQPCKFHAAEDKHESENSVSPYSRPFRSGVGSQSDPEIFNQACSSMIPSFCSHIFAPSDEQWELQSGSLPMLLQSLVAGALMSPSNCTLVLRAVSHFLSVPRTRSGRRNLCSMHTSAAHCAIFCAATALHHIRSTLIVPGAGAESHSSRFNTSGAADQRLDSGAPQAVADFLQAFVAWVQSQKHDQQGYCKQPCLRTTATTGLRKRLLPQAVKVRSVSTWLCSLFDDVGSPAIQQVLSGSSTAASSHWCSQNGGSGRSTIAIPISTSTSTYHSLSTSSPASGRAARSTAHGGVTRAPNQNLSCTEHTSASAAATAAAHMQMCVSVLRKLCSSGTDNEALHVLACQKLARTIRGAAHRQLYMTRELMTQLPPVATGTLGSCVTLLRHLMETLRALGGLRTPTYPGGAKRRPGELGLEEEPDKECCTKLQFESGGLLDNNNDINVNNGGEGGECNSGFAFFSFHAAEESQGLRDAASTAAVLPHVAGEEWLQVHLEVMRQLLCMELMHHLPTTATLLCEVRRALGASDTEDSPCKKRVQDQLDSRVAILRRMCDMHAKQLQHACDSTGQPRTAHGDRENAVELFIFVEASGDVHLCETGKDMGSRQGVLWSCGDLLRGVLGSGRGGSVLLHAEQVTQLCGDRWCSPEHEV